MFKYEYGELPDALNTVFPRVFIYFILLKIIHIMVYIEQ